MPNACILVIEDEPINQESLRENLAEEGYEVLCAASGEEAWTLMAADPARIDVILLDRLIPDMDGIEILRRAKAHPGLARTPVIMQTAMNADAEVAEGLRAGAYYYLTKPFSAETLLAIVAAASRDYRTALELRQQALQAGQAIAYLKSARFVFRTPAEARDIATLAANAAPDPGRVVLGLCELMLNAVEHGNLAIGYDDKTRLIEAGGLAGEITRRLARPEYGSREAELVVERWAGQVRFLIRDQGSGFDWRNYLEMSPERAFHTHGRGIALSRLLSFDWVEYRGNGNEVLAAVVC